VIYTSGSTGEPKGVMNVHQGICNRLLWMQDAYQLSQTDRVLQKTPYTFDVSLWEFFWPLLAGASLVVAQPQGHKDAAYLISLIAEEKISTLHFVPSMLQVFLEQQGLETCSSLRRVFCSGEALPFEFQQRFFARLGCELHNLYGPTEASVDVTYWACQRESQRPVVPIGQPIANTHIYLLDQHLNPVPVGVLGELHIAGTGLARGYLERPALTAEKFIPNPFPPSVPPPGRDERGGGARLYKTGDLARYSPDGNIEFLGRLDQQVKVRGVRIELGEIEAALRQHPTVQDAVALSRDTEHAPGHKQLVAYIIPDSSTQKAAVETLDTELPAEQVAEWQQVFDRVYNETAPPLDYTSNTAGWDSSYTGQPLPDEQMREWIDYAVERILSWRPGRVLEIGCGVGLLLFRIAPFCSEYWGTDISPAALRYLQQHLARPGRELPQVRLLQRAADGLDGLGGKTFDAVVLNSVVQYFPGIEYLVRVLKGVVPMVEPEGCIFVDDVRSLALLQAFHTSVELERAPSSLSTTHLKQRVQKLVNREQELVIDPAFFFTLRQELPQISHVEAHLKRGRHHNELTRFRYDVTFYIGHDVQPIALPCWDWQKEGLTLDAVRQTLLETGPEVVGITGVPNARLLPIIQAQTLLTQPGGPETVGELRNALQEVGPADGVDPEDWWTLSDELPYKVDVLCSNDGAKDSYTVLLRRHTAPQGVYLATGSAWSQGSDGRLPWQSYANNPLQEKLTHRLVPELRRHLKEKLSEYMVPSAFVLVNAWPLTPTGKLDRRALPPLHQAITEMESGFVVPRTQTEKKLAEIWSQVLGLEQVGIHDNFFDLGGDSILSVRVIARANKANIRLNTQQLFQHQTVSELAGIADLTRAEQIPAPEAISPRLDRGPDFALARLDPRKLDQLLADLPDIEDIYPLAPYQEYLLHRTLAEPESVRFVFQRVSFIPVSLDSSVLERALQHVVERYPSLRTSFIWEGLDEPLQIVHKHSKASLVQQDWRELSPAEQTRRLEAYAEAERARGFALDEPTGIRLLLARTGENACQILLTGCYMRGDGWSLIIVLQEIVALYQVFWAGQEPQLEQPPLYRDYIAWLQRQDQAEVEAFWRQNLKGFRSPTPLVSRAPGNSPGQDKSLARQHVYLPALTTSGLQSLAQQHRLTLSTLLQGAWALLLSHYTGYQDVVFGVTVAGRPVTLPQVEAIVGPTFNTLPRRVRVPHEASLLPWLKNMMAQQVKLSQYEYTRVHKIHAWSEVPKDQPLFESILVFQNLSSIAPRTAHHGYAQVGYPLRVDVFPETEMGLLLFYHEHCFDTATIVRMLGDLQTILEGFVANPERRLVDLMRLIVSARELDPHQAV
jgi:amino acid adenylation domain-containing protein